MCAALKLVTETGLVEGEDRARPERQARRQEPVERPVVRLVLVLEGLVVVEAAAEEQRRAVGVAPQEPQLDAPIETGERRRVPLDERDGRVVLSLVGVRVVPLDDRRSRDDVGVGEGRQGEHGDQSPR